MFFDVWHGAPPCWKISISSATQLFLLLTTRTAIYHMHFPLLLPHTITEMKNFTSKFQESEWKTSYFCQKILCFPLIWNFRNPLLFRSTLFRFWINIDLSVAQIFYADFIIYSKTSNLDNFIKYNFSMFFKT